MNRSILGSFSGCLVAGRATRHEAFRSDARQAKASTAAAPRLSVRQCVGSGMHGHMCTKQQPCRWPKCIFFRRPAPSLQPLPAWEERRSIDQRPAPSARLSANRPKPVVSAPGPFATGRRCLRSASRLAKGSRSEILLPSLTVSQTQCAMQDSSTTCAHRKGAVRCDPRLRVAPPEESGTTSA